MSSRKSEMPATARTAMSRSRPSALAKTVGELIEPSNMIFDWGCGKGCDVLYYLTKANTVCGWDPHFKPAPHPDKLSGVFNIVTCSCVLNVLQKQERKDCLQAISDFVSDDGTAYFSVRSKKDIDIAKKVSWKKKSDGWITSIGTFQHGFTSDELTRLLKPFFTRVELIKKTPLIIQGHD